MKIGILTYQYAMNYGALLQAYALKSYLESLKHEVEILNYDTSYLYNQQRSLKSKIISRAWSVVRNGLGGRKKNKKFELFRNDFLKLKSPVLTSGACLKEYLKNKEFDAFIVGSDQVWNPEINGNDFTYYLEFVSDEIKISYAASFGVSSLDEKITNQIVELVSTFNAVSVREKTGLNILKDLRNKAEVVLDPVFLPNIETWNTLADIKKVAPEKYLLCYVMPGDKVLEKKIEKLAEEYKKITGNTVVFLGRKEYKRFKNDGKDFVSADPIEFVNLFKNADQIITNSFHGTAFSIIFNKSFYSLVNTQISGKRQLSSRVIDLLEELRLNMRLIDVMETCDFSLEVEYETVNATLKKMKEHSRIFLIDALKQEKLED